MVTARKVFKADSYYMEYRGLHADPKPANAKEGDVFKELDTDSVYKFEGGKWVFSPGGAGGEGLSDGIDIIGTDKELKDLSAIAVGFDLPDIPGEPDITVSKTVKLAEISAKEDDGLVAVFESPLPFDLGFDINDLSIYGNSEPLFFSKIIKADIYFDGDTAYSGTFIGAFLDHHNNSDYLAEFLSTTELGFDFMYVPPQENHEGPFGLYVVMHGSPAGVNEVTITLTQEGSPAVTGRASEIAAKYIESPEVEKGLKFNALKEVGVGYVKEGDSITVVNDGTGETTTIESSLSMRKVSDVFPFDISGETEEMHGGALITLDTPITMEFSDPAFAQEVGNSIPYISSYPASITGGVTVYAGVASLKHPEPLFFYAEDDVEQPMGTLLKGLWVIDMTTPVNVAITSLTQGDPDTIHKIDAKFLDIPPVVDGEGTTDLKNFSKIAVGGIKGFTFTYDAAASYEIVTTHAAKIIKVAEFEDIDITNEGGHLKNPIRYRYSLKMGGSSAQELTGAFDVVSPADQGMFQIKDSTATSGVRDIVGLTVLENDYSRGGISLTRGVWAMFMPEGEEQIIPLNLAQETIVKIPSNYIDGAGYDAEIIIGPSKNGIDVRSYNFDFDSLVNKLNAEEPLNIKVDFAVDDSISSGYSPLAVTRIGIIDLDTYAIDIYVDSSNNSIKEEYYRDFPGYIEIFSNNNVHWIASPEDISIKFSVAGSGSYNMLASGTYNKLYDMVSTGKMPSVKAHITAQEEQMN